MTQTINNLQSDKYENGYKKIQRQVSKDVEEWLKTNEPTIVPTGHTTFLTYREKSNARKS
jgi:hypothetical protein